MSMRDLAGINQVELIVTVAAALTWWPVAGFSESPNLGRPATVTQIQGRSMNVFPNGRGLPSGSGTVAEGAAVYEQQCLSCHGIMGGGWSADELAGARHKLTEPDPDKIIGNYWPYATTLFDFIRRSMPLDNPGSLSDNQVYGVTAYLLHLNGLWDSQARMDAEKLAGIVMPNRDGFIGIDAH